LSHVVGSEGAISYLRKTRDLKEAYDLTDGEESMVRKLLGTANTKLEKALGVVHRHKTADVLAEAERCLETSTRILKTVQER
jgi:5-bromo-4-chloroindolyl phosphate hydrolysis protein